MIEEVVMVSNQLGLHARVATAIAKTVKGYACSVSLKKDGMEVDARSVLELLLLAATPGSEIVVRASGPDCESAVKEIIRLVQTD